MNKFYYLLEHLNEDKYRYPMCVKTKEELEEKSLEYIMDYEIDIDEEDFDNKDEYIKEKNKLKEQIEYIIEWKGEGEYCIAGISYDEYIIALTKDLAQLELGYYSNSYDFPIPIDIKLFEDPIQYISNWKKEEGYKYIYMIDWVKHVGDISLTNQYVVYSNNEQNNLINTLHKEKDIFIGEFNILGSNYNCIEVEDFDIDNFTSYTSNSFNPELIYLD